jgi:outer membrane protein OmpA-like peptidoglycan-associated protein
MKNLFKKIIRGKSFPIQVVLSLVVFSSQVMAEKVKSINTNSFNAGLNSSYLSLEDAYLYDQAFIYKRSLRRVFFYGSFTTVSNPWILMNQEGNKNVESIIAQMQTFDLAAGWLLSDTTQLSFATSFSNVKVAADYGGDNKNHWGDSRLQLKYRLTESEDMAMAIAPELYLPTGVHYVGDIYGAGLSNSSFGLGAKFITEFKYPDTRLNFNAGYSYFENAEIKGTPANPYPQIDGRSRLFLGLGVLSRLSEQWAWDNELTGNFTVQSNNFTPPGEISSGFRYQNNPETSWHFGLGSGAFRGFGGNEARFYVGFKTPFFEGRPPVEEKKEDLFWEKYKSEIKGPEEKGHDILLDSEVFAPEVEQVKSAPPVSEVRNQDFENMPIKDQEPAYLTKMETPKSSEEILPVIPNIEKKVIYEREKIEVLEDVSFDLNKSTLTPYGKAVLNQVVKVIKKHLNAIENLKIKGHTDHQGSSKINNPLSAARARTVRDYLVKKGIPKNILSAQGYGAQKPIYDFRKTPKKLWEKNRRVEFVVKEKEMISMRDR